MKSMDSPAGQGANRSNSGCHGEDGQRSHAGEGAISCFGVSGLQYQWPRPSMAPALVFHKSADGSRGSLVTAAGSPKAALIIHDTARTLQGVLG